MPKNKCFGFAEDGPRIFNKLWEFNADGLKEASKGESAGATGWLLKGRFAHDGNRRRVPGGGRDWEAKARGLGQEAEMQHAWEIGVNGASEGSNAAASVRIP